MKIVDLIDDLKAMIGPSCEVTDVKLQVWLEESFSLVIDKIAHYDPDYFSDVKTTSTQTNISEYATPDNFLKISNVNIVLDGVATELKAIDFHDIANIGGSNQMFCGYANVYYVRNGAIGVYPIPTYNGDNNLMIWYTYSPEFTDDNLAKLPLKLQLMIKHWAFANYLDQDDQHTAALNQRAFFERKITQMALDLTDREHDDPVYIKEV